MTTHPIGFDKSGQVLYLIDSRGRDTSAMTALDLKTGATAILAEDAEGVDRGAAATYPAVTGIGNHQKPRLLRHRSSEPSALYLVPVQFRLPRRRCRNDDFIPESQFTSSIHIG